MSQIEDTIAEAAERGAAKAIQEAISAAIIRVINEPDVLKAISEKEYITIPEAAMLYRGSEAFYYAEIRKAQNKKSTDPIPYRNYGTTVLPHKEFLEWEQRRREGKLKSKTKTGPKRLEAVPRTG